MKLLAPFHFVRWVKLPEGHPTYMSSDEFLLLLGV